MCIKRTKKNNNTAKTEGKTQDTQTYIETNINTYVYERMDKRNNRKKQHNTNKAQHTQNIEKQMRGQHTWQTKTNRKQHQHICAWKDTHKRQKKQHNQNTQHNKTTTTTKTTTKQ